MRRDAHQCFEHVTRLSIVISLIGIPKLSEDKIYNTHYLKHTISCEPEACSEMDPRFLSTNTMYALELYLHPPMPVIRFLARLCKLYSGAVVP